MHRLVRFFLKFVSIFIVTSIFIAAVSVSTDNAEITSDTFGLPNVGAKTYQVQDGDALYVDPTNSYNDNVLKYYLLTQDNAKAGLASVTYNGAEYPLEKVFVGTTTSAAKDAVQANCTLFVDDGTYDSDMHYCALSNTNFSLVGLNQTANGEPATIFVRTYTEDLTKKTVDSYRFIHENVYIGNIILDGAGKNMYANKTYGQYGVVVAKGSVNFVMDHVIIQNIGATNIEPFSQLWGTPWKNTAMQVLYESSGTRHFIDVTVRNVKTTNYGAGVVFQNQSKTYWKNLTIDATDAAANTYGMRVENADTSQLALKDNSAVFAGSCNISTGFIQVKNYMYSTIAMPSNYRYVEYTMSNANSSTGAYRVWTSIPDVSTNSAILDRADNYWVVRNTESVTTQLNAIDLIRDYLSNNVTVSADRIPGMNVRIVSTSSLANFTLPDCGGNTPITLIAVPSLSSLYTSTQWIPVISAFNCTFSNVTDVKNTLFSNMDFAMNAEYTMYEAVNVLSTKTDPLSANSFNNCKFIALAYGDPATPTLLTITTDKTEIYLSETAKVLATIPSFYTYENLLSYSANTGVDDPRIAYTSSDESVAAVDADGTVHPASIGSVTIHAAAIDKYNQGEVVRPSAEITINIVANPTPAPTAAPIVIPTAVPTSVPTASPVPSVSPTPGSDVLSADRNTTPTPSASDVLGTTKNSNSSVTKTGEKSDLLLIAGGFSALIPGGFLLFDVNRRKRKAK